MTQNRALQLLYDLRYLNIVLTAKGEEVKSSRSKQDSRYRHPRALPVRPLPSANRPFPGSHHIVGLLQHVSCLLRLVSPHITSRNK